MLNCGFKYAILSLAMPLFFSKLFIFFSIFMVFPTIWFSINYKYLIVEWRFLNISSCQFSLPIIIDPVGIIFSCVVLFISSNVFYFARRYIEDEIFIRRFMFLIILFVLSINLLIFIPHIISLLIGWDGLGIVSFLLVIYYQNPKSLGAGIITALTNRIGDVFILLSIGICLSQGHWFILDM